VVGGVDYKGVREIMKNCIEKAQTLPTHLPLSIRPQAEALTSVLSYIFNRKGFKKKIN
jgi:mediator of RNA polymerase II transcription subunit 23